MSFIELSSILPDVVLTKSYSIPVVILSISIAIFSSLTAFGTSQQASLSQNKSLRIFWIAFGATAMGLGIWAMHFIGMLALNLSIPVTYDVLLTVLSVFPAILACGVVFWMMNRKRNRNQLVIAGILLGAGIGSMHYIGMAAMRLNAMMIHDSVLFYLSILVAVILATIALMLQDTATGTGTDTSTDTFITKRQLLSAVVMGLAASGMHYTGMSAVNFVPQSSHQEIIGIGSNTLIFLVSMVTSLVLFVALLMPKLARNIEERKLAEQRQKELLKELQPL